MTVLNDAPEQQTEEETAHAPIPTEDLHLYQEGDGRLGGAHNGQTSTVRWAAWAQVTFHINHSTKENSPGQFFSCGVRSHSNGAVSVWMLCYLGKFSPVNDILFSRRKQQNKKISSHFRITTLISKASPLQAASQSLFSSSNNPLQNDNLAFFCIKSVVSSLYQVLLTRRHVLKEG